MGGGVGGVGGGGVGGEVGEVGVGGVVGGEVGVVGGGVGGVPKIRQRANQTGQGGEMKTLEIYDDENIGERIPRSRLVKLPEVISLPFASSVITRRISGDFAYHALILPSKYEWIIGKDNEDIEILVPLKK